jgi:hypothetical protein
MKGVICIAGIAVLSGCTSIEEKAQHNQAQIDIVRVQRDAQRSEKLADAEAKKALYEALAAVAQANPDQAGAVTVALAVQGLGGDDNADSTPIIGLQASRNEALRLSGQRSLVAMSRSDRSKPQGTYKSIRQTKRLTRLRRLATWVQLRWLMLGTRMLVITTHLRIRLSTIRRQRRQQQRQP